MNSVRRIARTTTFGLVVLMLGLLFVLDRPGSLGILPGGDDDVPWRPVCVHLQALDPGEAYRWEPEATGLLLAMLEGGIAMIPDATVRVADRPPPPGRPHCELEVPSWDARLETGGKADDLLAALWLCSPERRCRVLEARGTLWAAEDIARELLRGVARALDVDASVGLGWTEKQSRDPYAQLLSGRSAAVWYGLVGYDAPPEDGKARRNTSEAPKRRDPHLHAAIVDPKMPIAGWMVARRALAAGDVDEALSWLPRGNRPGADPVDLAEAEAYKARGQPTEAVAVLDRVQAALPHDRRIALERAAARVDAGQLEEARALLESLPGPMGDWPRFLEVSVLWKEAAGEPLQPDGLLARWQARAPWDPRPVRKRIDVYVGLDQFEEALALTPELAKRGQLDTARRLRLALAAQLRDWATAATAARELGDEVLARAMLDEDVGKDGKLSPVEIEAIVARARAAHDAGRGEETLAALDRVLREDPWVPEALALRAEILAASGRDAQARADLCRLREVDPAHGGLAPTGADALAWLRRCEEGTR